MPKLGSMRTTTLHQRKRHGSVGSIAAAAWSPLSEASLLWYIDAADLGSLTKDSGTGKVSAWNNLAPTGMGNLVQPASGIQPIWSASLVNGGPGVDNNPASSNSMLAAFNHSGPDALLVAVFSMLSDSVSGGVGISFAPTGVASSGLGGLNMRRASTLEQLNCQTDTASFGPQNVTYDVPVIYSTQLQTGVGGTAWLNGGNIQSLSRASVVVDFDIVVFGSSVTSGGVAGSTRMRIKLRAAMLFSSVALAVRQKAEGFAAWLPGMTPITLAAGHPYLSAPP